MTDPKREDRPNCHECKHRRTIPGDCHSACANESAKVEGAEFGIRGGWFHWPFNFDPNWLVRCDGFELKDREISKR